MLISASSFHYGGNSSSARLSASKVAVVVSQLLRTWVRVGCSRRIWLDHARCLPSRSAMGWRWRSLCRFRRCPLVLLASSAFPASSLVAFTRITAAAVPMWFSKLRSTQRKLQQGHAPPPRSPGFWQGQAVPQRSKAVQHPVHVQSSAFSSRDLRPVASPSRGVGASGSRRWPGSAVLHCRAPLRRRRPRCHPHRGAGLVQSGDHAGVHVQGQQIDAQMRTRTRAHGAAGRRQLSWP